MFSAGNKQSNTHPDTVRIGVYIFSLYNIDFPSSFFIMLWDVNMHSLDDKGGIGIFINIAVLIALLILRWPVLSS